jgi:hypothetical protein
VTDVDANARERQDESTVEEGGSAEPRRGRGTPPPLPLEARRAIWERIWAHLLAPPAHEQGTDDATAADAGEDAA